MPPLPPVGQVIKVTFSGVYSTTKWANIFHVLYGGSAPSNANLTTLAASLATAWQTGLGPAISDDVELTLCQCQDLTSSSGAYGQAIVALLGTFAHVSPFSAQVAAVISWQIQRHYRGGHPRTYLPGQDGANSLNPKQWTAGWTTTLGARGNAFLGSVNTLGGPAAPYQLGTVSYFINKATRSVPVFEAYLAAVGKQKIDSQRRRLGK